MLYVERFLVVAYAYDDVYIFDPAFKPRTITPPRSPWADMGYSRSNFLATALSGATSDTNNYVSRLNDAGIRTAMNQFAGSLATAWHAAASNANAKAFAGGDDIVPQGYSDNISYHGILYYGPGVDILSYDPATINLFRMRVTLTHGALTNNLWLDEIATRTVWIDYTNATGYVYPKAVLHVDDATVATEATGSSQTNAVTATIAVTNLIGAFSSAPYALVRSNANVYTIPVAVSTLHGGMRDRAARKLERVRAVNSAGSHRITAQAVQVTGQEWLLQTACNEEALGRLSGQPVWPFYRLGIAGQRTAS
jgi:hypothetical protein